MFTTVLLAAALTIQDYATMPAISSPIISPDGMRIVYVVTRADMDRSVYDSDLWLAGVDGSTDIQLTHSNSTNNHPRWWREGPPSGFRTGSKERRAACWCNGARSGGTGGGASDAGGVSRYAPTPTGTSRPSEW